MSSVDVINREALVERFGGQRPGGRLKFVNHTLVTFEFEEVEALELEDFGPQNVLFDMGSKRSSSRRGGRSRSR